MEENKEIENSGVVETSPLPPPAGESQPAEVRDEPTEMPKEAIPQLTFGQSINFNTIFRVKGRKNLFMQLSKPQKNGYVGMIEVGVDNAISVHQDNLECLGAFVFYKNDGSKIRMGQVFDNLEKLTIGELGKKNDLELMDIMCPDYDAEKFKTYHGQKVIEWYFEIKEKIALSLKNKQT